MVVTLSKKQRLFRLAVLGLVLALFAGCAAKKAYNVGEREMRRENFDRAVLVYSKAVALDPGNSRYSVALERAKLRSSGQHFDRGRNYASAAQLELAVAEFQQALLLNPGHQHAANELQRVVRDLRRRDALPSEIEQLKEQQRRRSMGPPQLDPKTNIAIQLSFTEVEMGKIFEAIGKASGINFIFDDKVDLDKPMSIDVGNVTLEKALDILLLQSKLFFKAIDEYTLLVAPDTRPKRQEYEDQVIRTFFLSNADTKQVVTLLRSLLQSRQIAENPDLNSVTIKDTPDKVAIADRIIRANDKSKGEVLIDVELLEINRTVAKTLGIDLSSKALSLSFLDGMSSLPLNNTDLIKQRGNWSIGVVPSVILDFFKSDSDTRTIAKPQLRVSEGEQAEILIGDRVPIPTTSFNTSQTIGGNIVPITSFTYQNVGITVQMEPRVHHNKEVTLRVQVEISQISGSVDAANGQSQPIIGTRQIQTVIRLRDGETNMLAGLIQRVKSDSRSGIPGVLDTPGLGRIFGRSTIEDRETDIIMTITPRIIRIPDITEDDLAPLWVGTEENMRLRGPTRNALNQSPFATAQQIADASARPTAEPLPAVPLRTGGALNRISTPQVVAQDRVAAEQERAAAAAAAESKSGESPDLTPTPAVIPGRTGSSQSSNSDSPGDDPPQTPAVVRLIPSRATYNVGEPVVVNVFVENAQQVGSIPFHLRYNSEVLQFVAPGQEGPFMSGDGTSTVFLASDTGGGGEIVVGLSRMGGGEGISGAGSLATFQFLAISPGDCGFAFTGASVKDPQTRNLPASFNTVSVRVE